MTEKDLELLVTIDDTGEDEVPEIFDHLSDSLRLGGEPQETQRTPSDESVIE